MAQSTSEWIDELKSISVLELSERIKALEEEFGGSAQAAAVAAPAGGGGGQGARLRGPQGRPRGRRPRRGREAQAGARRGRRERGDQVGTSLAVAGVRRAPVRAPFGVCGHRWADAWRGSLGIRSLHGATCTAPSTHGVLERYPKLLRR